MNYIELIKAAIIGIIEGLTEWLPISSTGHMILAEQFIKLNVTDDFKEMFNVVIQLGAILAVVTLSFGKLNPWSPKKDKQSRKDTWSLWGKVLVGCVPAGVAGLLLDDWFDEHLYKASVVAIMLIVYGVLFVVIETINRNREPKINEFAQLSYKTALIIGLAQVLALVPGTSRSGVTILAAMLIGCSRYISAEFTFFMAIPIMAGASGLKVLKYILKGLHLSGSEWGILIVGCVVAYVVSVLAIKFLMSFIKKHDFEPFGYYRIILGAVILGIMYNDVFTTLV